MSLNGFFNTANLTPHGFCLFWQPQLIWLHVISDTLIGCSYYTIPLALAYFVSKRTDMVFSWIFWFFAAFILACGTTHFFEIWTLWHPDYALQGIIKSITALVSVTTAISIWFLLPKALAMPSPSQLRKVNQELSEQIHQRSKAVEALQKEILERQKVEEALRQSQKMEGLGQLTGGVAHDFNNLLLILQGNMQVLKQKTADLQIDAQINNIDRALARGESLTRQLLTFARRQTLQPKAINLSEEMITLQDLLKRFLRGDIEIEVNIASGSWPIEVDPNEFELAVINIASNARDAMPNGGILKIDIDNQVMKGSDDTAELTGDFVRIAISDTGRGIPQDIVGRIFEPFFTTKEVDKGTGLGLSQVYGFAKQSGGLATVVSEDGKGTTIVLHLPRSFMIPTPAKQTEETNEKTDGHSTILLVEDNPEVAEIGTVLLEQLGYVVKEARTAAQALNILNQGDSIDLVFSDVVMPGGISGIDLARMLRQEFPHIPVLLTTGYSIDAQEATAEGFTILTKPYKLDALHTSIQQALNKLPNSRTT